MQDAVLSARHDAGGGLQLVTLDVRADAVRAYTTPGQYIEVKTDAGDGYFVLASDVAKPPWLLLVKNVGGASESLATLPIGSTVAFEGPLGAGFPVARMKDRHVVVAVVASALGVACPVVARRIAEGAASSTHLFLGLRAPSDLPMAAEVREWSMAGVEVVLCLSRGELDLDRDVLASAKRFAGYVQHALARALETGEVPHGALVVAAGPEAMLADMRSIGGSATFPLPGRVPSIEVLTNV